MAPDPRPGRPPRLSPRPRIWRAPLGGSGGGLASARLLPHAEATAAVAGAPEARAEDGGAIAEGRGGKGGRWGRRAWSRLGPNALPEARTCAS